MRNPYAYSRGRTCATCAVLINNYNKSGRCVMCGLAHRQHSEDFQAKRLEGIRKAYEDPEFRERQKAGLRRAISKLYADPEYAARMRERGEWLYANKLNTPEAKAALAASRGRAGQSNSERRLGWCPPEYRGLHRRNVFSKRMRSAESRAAIEAMIADRAAHRDLDDAIRWLNRLAPTKKLDTGLVRYGMAELRPSEIVDRAKLKGWQPEQLAA